MSAESSKFVTTARVKPLAVYVYNPSFPGDYKWGQITHPKKKGETARAATVKFSTEQIEKLFFYRATQHSLRYAASETDHVFKGGAEISLEMAAAEIAKAAYSMPVYQVKSAIENPDNDQKFSWEIMPAKLRFKTGFDAEQWLKTLPQGAYRSTFQLIFDSATGAAFCGGAGNAIYTPEGTTVAAADHFQWLHEKNTKIAAAWVKPGEISKIDLENENGDTIVYGINRYVRRLGENDSPKSVLQAFANTAHQLALESENVALLADGRNIPPDAVAALTNLSKALFAAADNVGGVIDTLTT